MATQACATATAAEYFRVTRRHVEIVRPEKPTPNEYKTLSDIDDQDLLRTQSRAVFAYRRNSYEAMRGSDPVKVVRDGLAKALVHFYPLAGRLRERPGKKLVVECTGEGVPFIKADCDFTFEQLGNELQASELYFRELVYDVPGSEGILGCPLLLVQVTCLSCGGFVLGLRVNHALMDGVGTGLLMKAVAEMARGATAPSILPVWHRELLCTQIPQRTMFRHYDYDEVNLVETDISRYITSLGPMISRSFFFGPSELAAIRGTLAPQLRKRSTFDVLASFLWRSRIIAFALDPKEEVGFLCYADVRSKVSPPLPVGYYGNAILGSVAMTKAGMLCHEPLEYTMELVRNAKTIVSEEFTRSFCDLMASRVKPAFTGWRFYRVSDLTRSAMDVVDFGWGKAEYSMIGPVEQPENTTGSISFLMPVKDKGRDGRQNGIMVPIRMPERAMERFAQLMGELKLVRSSM